MNTTFDDFRTSYSAAEALPEERASFIRKTYAHLAGAVLIFTLMEAYLIHSGAGLAIAQTMLGGRFSWLIVLGAFMGVSMLATWWANSQTSRAMQYMGLGLYLVAEVIIFLPLLYIVASYADGYQIFAKAGLVTGGLFLGLTSVVFLTRKDFSFLGPILAIGGFVALGLIVASLLFGFTLGNVFSFAMVAFAGGAILYQTSGILHQYRPNQHVAASLALFASVALLFWYIIRIFMGSKN
ncbi:MAG: Bax inhibitor-1 family protein [Acidobacteria bacterium]|jgi:FtsH-binding integral membrane protein|nr:Bax inhibitor-1 family protein [Acidobacteriota bacterium]